MAIAKAKHGGLKNWGFHVQEMHYAPRYIGIEHYKNHSIDIFRPETFRRVSRCSFHNSLTMCRHFVFHLANLSAIPQLQTWLKALV